LQFDSRGEEAQAQQLYTVKPQPVLTSSSAVTASDATVESASQLMRSIFGSPGDGDTPPPDTLVSQMEAALVGKRDSWAIGLSFLIRFCPRRRRKAIAPARRVHQLSILVISQ
jgi:hypothetical protein